MLHTTTEHSERADIQSCLMNVFLYLYSQQVVETDESVLDDMSVTESTGELGYSGIVTPSPPLSLDEHSHSPASASVVDNDDEDSLYPRIAHVQSVNIKVEPLDDNEDPDQVHDAN